MRLILKISPNNTLVPFNYQKYLVGCFHKWLGENKQHDDVSLYSLSWLQGGEMVKGGLKFKHGSEWSLSAYHSSLLKTLVINIKEDPKINFGMGVEDIVIMKDPPFENKQKFFLNSPVFIKRNQGDRIHYYLFNDSESDELMTRTLQTKLKKADLDSEGVRVSFDRSYHSPKTKMIDYNEISCRASMCPVFIEGSQEQVAFAWNVGIGNSTGIGFGALK
ncbi:CRISPR-associated endoribonuclease Cas6 [Cyclobacterium lianum]|uniref:CRISPR-associated endoribonuclease Cas6 n=1 Tax=Cyclobacterium lianum TaxID=388280 RepID=A0A1M7NKL0_9BACT|nr:CRISPR-associated endoribonuclease Cas6 [Cyclobacterium lianum]SHN04270.1 CRISPR-associated endoribonuclease Cas6 [Cyclobacterium lianum]